MSKLLNKLRNIDYLPIILFIIIIINFLPLGIPNFISNTFGTKASYAADTISTAICFVTTCIMLFCVLYKKITMCKEIKKDISILTVFVSILLVMQIINIFNKNFFIKDVVNVFGKGINILFFIILMKNIVSDTEKISLFMKCIIYTAIIACVYNMIFFIKEILYTIGIIDGMKNVKVKSFFGNRNQFAFFLFISVCSNIYILLKENKNIYKFTLILFLLNLFFTMSRTGILVTGIFIVLYTVLTDRINFKTKLRIFIILSAIVILGGIMICFIYPDILERLLTLLIRPEHITDLSGRTKIWKVAKDILGDNIFNIMFGVGRFKGIKAIADSGKSFTQFHNTYIEAVVSGGIMELLYIAYLYTLVFLKIKRSNMEKKYKIFYFSAIISFLIYILLESYGKFSIGYVDT